MAWGPGTGLSGGQARRCHCVEVMRRSGGAGGRCAFLLIPACLQPTRSFLSSWGPKPFPTQHHCLAWSAAVAGPSFPSTEVRSVPCFWGLTYKVVLLLFFNTLVQV